jgi:hypothetical protein
LQLDDGFGAFQAQRQTGIIALSQSQFGCQRVGFNGLRAALGGRQGTNAPASRCLRHSVRDDE